MSGLCCPGSLPALSAARTVPCVLNPKRIQSLLLSSSGGLIWLTNEHFPNEGNSSPQSHHSLYTSFAHFCPYLCAFFSSARRLSLALVPFHLFLRHWSPSFCILSSQQFLCTFFTLSISHFSPLPTAIHQLFAISFLFPLFIVSSIKSIYNSGSLSNCCATKILYGGGFNSNAVVVSAICPVLLYLCVVSSASQLNVIVKVLC